MKKKVLVTFAFCAALLLGFGLGHLRAPATAQARVPLYYVDPMHPAYHSDKPGIAPDCGMKLEPVFADDPLPSAAQSAAGISVNPEQQQLIGIKTERVIRNSGGGWPLRTTGRVEADNSRVYRLIAGTVGWVQSSESRPAGSLVKKDEQLATFYSEEFRNAEQAYLGSIASVDRVKGTHEQEDSNRLSDASLRLNEERLRSLGMGEAQIKELAKSHQTTRDIALTSPVDGVVLASNINPAERFDKGDELYRIGDLSHVWILADVSPSEAKVLRPGARVKVTVPELDRTVFATVAQAPPMFDNVSRTLKVRLQAINPGMLLRPDMFVDLEVTAPLPPGLFIPQEALLDSGRQKVAYVETHDHVFEPRQVEIGTAYGNQVSVLSGLEEGDRVVTSGHFLIDSETRMRSAATISAGIKPQALVADHDPVCGMSLDGNHATSHTAQFKGETFSFCSEKCQRKFEQDPAKYAGEKIGRASISQPGIHD